MRVIFDFPTTSADNPLVQVRRLLDRQARGEIGLSCTNQITAWAVCTTAPDAKVKALMTKDPTVNATPSHSDEDDD